MYVSHRRLWQLEMMSLVFFVLSFDAFFLFFSHSFICSMYSCYVFTIHRCVVYVCECIRTNDGRKNCRINSAYDSSKRQFNTFFFCFNRKIKTKFTWKRISFSAVSSTFFTKWSRIDFEFTLLVGMQITHLQYSCEWINKNAHITIMVQH